MTGTELPNADAEVARCCDGAFRAHLILGSRKAVANRIIDELLRGGHGQKLKTSHAQLKGATRRAHGLVDGGT